MLRVGSTGPNVQSLQQQLKNKGYFKGTTTQYFGSITKNAVMAFQRANGLSVDGIAGPATLSKLKMGVLALQLAVLALAAQLFYVKV